MVDILPFLYLKGGSWKNKIKLGSDEMKTKNKSP